MPTPLTVLLGPQRFEPTLKETLRSIGVDGPVAAVTAGWQEREDEVHELFEHLDGAAFNLELYRRHDDVLGRDAELKAALRERQDRLRYLQSLYRHRLDSGLTAARELLDRDGDDILLKEHRRAAIRSVRTLDRQHLTRIRALHQEHTTRYEPSRRPAVVAQRQQIAALIERSAALVVAGGNVAILLNRLRLFDIPSLLGDRPVIAWSAGAMALSERVVLFHDSPPQGPGNAELFDAGLALCRRLLPLPSARARLRLNDPTRVELFARRFSPAACVPLERGTRVDWHGDGWTPGPGTKRLSRKGGLTRMHS